MEEEHDKAVSNSDLMSSAKILASAAKSTVSHDGNKVDKAQIADATADLLSAAKHYGNLEDKSYGKYIDKAEDYLHQYHSSNSPTDSPSSATQHDGEGKHDQNSGSGGDGGGFGEYVKLAQGLLKKPDQSHGDGDGDHSSSGIGGAVDCIKMAEGLLKKN